MAFLAMMLLTSLAAAAETVNLNKANAAAIQQNLIGIGPVKAEAIISYRKKNGKFKSIDDLQNVKGLGPALIKKNKRYLSLSKGVTTGDDKAYAAAKKQAGKAKSTTSKKSSAKKTTSKSTKKSDSTKASSSSAKKKPAKSADKTTAKSKKSKSTKANCSKSNKTMSKAEKKACAKKVKKKPAKKKSTKKKKTSKSTT